MKEELYGRKWKTSTKAGEDNRRMRNLRNRIKRGIEEKKEENKKDNYKYHNKRRKSEEAKKY
jgi:uncharacterized protein YpuA (DUF1002 family)